MSEAALDSFSHSIDVKPKQLSSWTGPLEVKRVTTDFSISICFGVFIMFWIAILIYAIFTGNSEHFYHPNHFMYIQYDLIMQFFSKYINEAKYVILGFIAWSGLLLLIFIILFRWTTKAFVIITIVLSFTMLVLMYSLIIYATCLETLYPCVYIFAVAIAILYGLFIYAFIKSGIKTVCKIIKESCKAMFFFPSTLILAIIQFSLQLQVAAIASRIYMYLISISIPEYTLENMNATSSGNETEELISSEIHRKLLGDLINYETAIVPVYIYLFHIVNLFCFLWATWFIMGLGRMVLTATFATWYQAKDKNSIPKKIVLKCFIMITNHHIGTLAYASSPLTVIPMFYIIWKHGLERLKEIYKQPILILAWLTILLKFSFDAMTMCAIHGNTFYKSAKESYILHMKHPVSYLTMNTVSEYVIVLGTLLLPTLSYFSIFGYCVFLTPDLSNGAKTTATVIVTIASLMMSLTFFTIFRSASNTIRYCYLEDSKFNNEAEMKLFEIHVDDVSIHDIHQEP